MGWDVLSRGVVIGFSIAAPVGPIGVLCIRRTLALGQVAGVLSGLGAATADAIYGVIAGFGLTIMTTILIEQLVWLRILGGLFLIYLGVRTFLAKPAQEAASVNSEGLLGIYGSTLLLTLTNPATILSFVAIFAGLGLATAESDPRMALVLVGGVFLGSALWWLMLSTGVTLLHKRFKQRFKNGFTSQGLQWLNRVSGCIIIAFGVVALLFWRSP